MTGARIILNAAEEVTDTPIGWRDEDSRLDLTRELAIQCHARTHESFGSRTSAVLEAVVAAACQIGPCWSPNDAINRFIFNQTDSFQKLTEVLGRVGLGQTWQIFTITEEDGQESFYLATDEIYQQATEDLREATVKGAVRRILRGIPMIGYLIVSVPAPRIRLIATARPAGSDTANDALNADAEPDDTDSTLGRDSGGARGVCPNCEQLHCMCGASTATDLPPDSAGDGQTAEAGSDKPTEPIDGTTTTGDDS